MSWNKSQPLIFSKRGCLVRYGGQRERGGRASGQTVCVWPARQRWGVSDAALCVVRVKDAPASPYQAGWLVGGELGKERARAAGTDVTYPSYMPAGIPGEGPK